MSRIPMERIRSSRPKARTTVRIFGCVRIAVIRPMAAFDGSAGAADRRRRRRTYPVRLFALSAVSVALAACGGKEHGMRLMDGSFAPHIPEALSELKGRVVMTRVATQPLRSMITELGSCALGD